MARKVRGVECANTNHWALPERVTEENYRYAQWCHALAGCSVVCDVTMRTKKTEHEQYCKRYVRKGERDRIFDDLYEKEVLELEAKIRDFERMKPDD